MIDEALYDLLATHSALTAYVKTRIFPLVIPQGTVMPCVTYQQITGQRQHTSGGAFGTVQSTFQIDCWSETPKQAHQIAEVIRKLLDGYQDTNESMYIQAAFLMDEGDTINTVAGTDELTRFGKRLDFEIWFSEETS